MRHVVRPKLIEKILEGYSLPIFGIHGIRHWARVYENGMKLGEKNNVNRAVVQLFSVFHDSKRINEAVDPGHGRRAAEFLNSLRGLYIHLDEDEFELLYTACAHHTDELTHPDITVQTCFDADRLDLARAGIRVDPDRLCTAEAKMPETIAWAIERSLRDHAPEIIRQEWLLSP